MGSDLLLYNAMKHSMTYLAERQSVIAQNVANADTPGYKAKELEKPDFSKMVELQNNKNARLETTHEGHIAPNTKHHHYRIREDHSVLEQSANGNSVSLEDQMMKMNQNTLDYQTTTTLYGKMNELMRLSLGGNNN